MKTSTKLRIFLAGYIFCSAWRSISQDILGKEEYIALVNIGWVSAWYTVPIAILMIIVSLMLYHKKEK